MGNARNLADNLPLTGAASNRNIIINGGFQVFQRSTAVVTASTGFQGYYSTADRWKIYSNTGGGNYTTERSTDTPSGTGFSLKAVVTTAKTSLSSSHYANFDHFIEAQNCQHLAYGTAAAKTLTVSFFVKSSKTGIYTIALYKPDTTAYMYTKEYTINSANTWEKKTITITPTAGGTSFITSSGGAIANDNGLGLGLSFNQAFGSSFSGGTSDVWGLGSDWNYSTTNAVNWMDTVGNTFYLAEVQLELGSKATPFEHEPVGVTLSKCQRYYYKWSSSGLSDNIYVASPYVSSPPNSSASAAYTFPVTMRANPTMGGAVGLSLSRFTASVNNAVAQIGSSSGANAFALTAWTADAELSL